MSRLQYIKFSGSDMCVCMHESVYLRLCVYLHGESEVSIRFCSSGASPYFLRQSLISLELMGSAKMTAVDSRNLLPLQHWGTSVCCHIRLSLWVLGTYFRSFGVCMVLTEHLHPTAHAALCFICWLPLY